MTQSISRAAKPLGYYVSNPQTIALAQQYGDHLDGITAEHKAVIASAIYHHMAIAARGDEDHYGICDSLILIDPDGLLGDELNEFIIQIGEESYASDLAGFLMAISAFISDDARNGVWD